MDTKDGRPVEGRPSVAELVSERFGPLEADMIRALTWERFNPPRWKGWRHGPTGDVTR